MNNRGLIFVFLLAWVQITSAAPVGSSITYQGELNESGAPVNGIYDFNFQLFDELAAGSNVTPMVPVDDVTVTDGRFTVAIDFGGGPYDGEAVFLEIGVRPDGGGGYTTLSPRQNITPSPYSIRALSVQNNSINSDSIIDSSIKGADIAPDEVGLSQINSNEVQARVLGICPPGQAMIEINQNGTVNCEAATDADWSTNANTTWTMKDVAVGGSDATIGTGTFAVHSPNSDTFGGMFVNVPGTGFEQPFYGYATNNNFRAWTEFDELFDFWRVNINNAYPMTLHSSGLLETSGAHQISTTTTDPVVNTIYGNSVPIAYGSIDAVGGINTGYGVASVNNSNTGIYEITLDLETNPANPTVVITPFTLGIGIPEIAGYEALNANTFRVNIQDVAGVARNSAFSFVVFGAPSGSSPDGTQERPE